MLRMESVLVSYKCSVCKLTCGACAAGTATRAKPKSQLVSLNQPLSSIDLKGSRATKLIAEAQSSTKHAAVKDLIALCVLANMFDLPPSLKA